MRNKIPKAQTDDDKKQTGWLVILFFTAIVFSAGEAFAQRGTADAGYYPVGYSGETWTGQVTAFDNDLRTLTLTFIKGNKVQTFVATIPDTPYHQARDDNNLTVLDFPYDKDAEFQKYQYANPKSGGSAILAPFGDTGTGGKTVPNPPASNIVTDFSNFKGLRIMVYYTERERVTKGVKETYNDVWRIRVVPKK